MSRIALCLYGALVNAHIEADVISADMVRHGRIANRYKALVFAGVATVDQSLAAAVEAFAESGGLVIADDSIARLDELGQTHQAQHGFGSDQFLGAKKPLKIGKGNALLVEKDAKFWAAETGGSELSHEMADWLKTYAGVLPEVKISGDGVEDVSRLIDVRGNELDVVTFPQNKVEPEKPNQTLTIDLPNLTGKSQSFLVAPGRISEDVVTTGAIRIPAHSITPELESHAVILTARDHAPLIRTGCRRSWKANSTVSVTVTVYNPSPRPLKGALELAKPAGWKKAMTTNVALPPFGETTFTATVNSGNPTPRAVLYAALFYNGTSVDSIPFDVTVH